MPVRFVLNRAKRFFIYRVLHVDDTPHRIALGVAVGIFVTWTPTIGFQMILTILLSLLLGGNKLVGVPFVWISNPLTIVPIYWPNYLLGRWLLGGNYPKANFLRAIHWGSNWIDKVQLWWTETWKVFEPLWLGSVIVGLALGIAAYFGTYYAVVGYRKHRLRTHPVKGQ